MTSFNDAFSMLGTSLHDALKSVGNNVPQYVAALLIVLLGAVAGYLAKWIVVFILRSINLRNVSKRVRWNMVFSERYDGVELAGDLVRWFFVLVFFVTAMEVVSVPGVSGLVHGLINYLPKAFAAAVVLGVGGILASLAGRMVGVVGQLFGSAYTGLVGWLVTAAIWVTVVLVALGQFGLSSNYVNDLFFAFVGMLALGGGLAFGMGGRDWAAGTLKGLTGHFQADKYLN
jgi:hypothetical protein